MKCLDSDFLIAVLRGDERVKRKMEEINEEGGACTTSINAFEILYGALRSSKRDKNLREAKGLLSALEILPLDYGSAEKASELQVGLIEKGEQIGLKDMFIASTAFTRGCSIVTKNAKHFSKMGLKVEEW